jgi:signal transduction histidine kinase/CheY-like chemotaxis protein
MIGRLTDAQVACVFPFHLVLDSELRIVGHGPSLAKIDPTVAECPWFVDLFRIRTPRIAPEFEILYRAAGGVGGGAPSRSPKAPGPRSTTAGSGDSHWAVEGTSKPGAQFVLDHLASGLTFRMQLLASDTPSRVTFVGSPLLTTKKQLDHYTLTLSDFAPFDFSLDYLLALRMKDSLIEETKDLARSLQHANEELEVQVAATLAANRASDLFLMTMSHEIRTPMNAITGLTSLLLQMDPASAQRQHLATIETAARTLQLLLDGVLEYSKLESGTFDRSEENFDPHDVVEEVVRLFGPLAREKGLKLGCTIGDDVPRVVRGQVSLFNRVLINLTQNALKFTQEGGVEIDVTARPSASQSVVVRVEVADTGIGIAAADQGRVFDRFTQVHDAASLRSGGSGLGLAISRNICESCGGRIGVESTLGQGTLFWFEFPFRTQSDALQASAAPANSTPQTKLEDELGTSLPILVVDDNAINRNMVVDMITWLGIETESAADGYEALACTARREFGAILMDIRMPNIDGYETTRRIRSGAGPNSESPIIGLSANAFPEDRQAGFAAGMNDYLAKPITMATLTELLNRSTQAGFDCERSAPLDTGGEPPTAGRGRLSVEAAELVASSPLMEAGDSSVLFEYLQEFVAAAPDAIAALRQALRREDFDEISRQAHNLKGNSLFLGIDALTRIAHRLELAAQKQDLAGAADELTRVGAELAQIVASLQTPTASPSNDDLQGSR